LRLYTSEPGIEWPSSPRRRCASKCRTGPRGLSVVCPRVTIKPRPQRRQAPGVRPVEAMAGPVLATSRAWSHGDQGRIDMAETVIERLNNVWARTDRIFDLLKPEAFLAQAITLRHPFIFYVGHLPAFAWNHVGGGVLGRPSFHPGFDELFSRGIDP